MRGALATAVALLVLAGAFAGVARQGADQEAVQRARLAGLIAKNQECDIGCTASTRAKERAERQDTNSGTKEDDG